MSRVVLPLVGILVLSIGLVGLYVPAYPKLSPFDETMHYDSIVEATHLHIVRLGEPLTQQADRLQACRGIDYTVTVPPCGLAHYVDAAVAGGPSNSAAIHPPGYYFVTAALAQPLRWVGFSLFDAARLVGALWLAAGLLFTWLCMRDLGVGPFVRWSITALLASTPMLLHASSTINNDATGLLTGALPLWLGLRFTHGRGRWWVLGLVAVACMWLKDSALLGLLAAALVMVLVSAARARTTETASGWRTRLRIVWNDRGSRGAAALVLGTAIGGLSWVVVKHLIALPGAAQPKEPFSTILTVGNLVMWVPKFVTPVLITYVPSFLDHDRFTVVASVLGFLLIGGTFGALLGAGRPPVRRIGAVAALGMLLGGPLLWLIVSISNHASFAGLATRYSYSLAPIAAVATAGMLTLRAARWSVAALALFSVADTAITLVGQIH